MLKKYYYEKNTNEQLLARSAQLIYAENSRDDHDWKSLMHSHDVCEVFYITSGRGFFQMEEDRYEVVKDDVVIVNPHVAHLEHSEGEQPLEYIVLAISDVEFRTADNRYGLDSPVLPRGAKRRQSLRYCFQAILDELSDQPEHYLLAIDNLLTWLLIQLSREVRLYGRDATEKVYSPQILIAKQYLDNYYANRIDIDFLAQKTFLSKYHFIRQFKEEVGESPMSYLSRRRIREACSLLVYSDYSVTQICNMVGFDNPLYFSQSFKKAVGVSPTVYRTTHRRPDESGPT